MKIKNGKIYYVKIKTGLEFVGFGYKPDKIKRFLAKVAFEDAVILLVPYKVKKWSDILGQMNRVFNSGFLVTKQDKPKISEVKIC